MGNQEYDRQYYQDHKESIKKRSREWSMNNPDRVAVIQKRYRKKYLSDKKNVEKMNQRLAKYRKNNREKISARNKLQWALRMGYIKKASACFDCGKEGSGRKLQGYQYKGYDHPLDVIWLCPACRYKRSHS